MSIDSQLNELLKAFAAHPTTLRQFIDANLDPQAPYHEQVLAFTKSVDQVLQTQNDLNDWATGHIHMKKKEQDPHYITERAKLNVWREHFVFCLQNLLEAFWQSKRPL